MSLNFSNNNDRCMAVGHGTIVYQLMTFWLDLRIFIIHVTKPGYNGKSRQKLNTSHTGRAGSVVEHPLRDREVVGSKPGRAIPKSLKMVPVATLLGAQHYKARTGFSSPNKISHNSPRNTSKINKSEKSLIIINVCIHRNTVWKTGSYAKYVILLKNIDYYY